MRLGVLTLALLCYVPISISLQSPVGSETSEMFGRVSKAPEDSVFRITRMFNECTDPLKTSCGVGGEPPAFFLAIF